MEEEGTTATPEIEDPGSMVPRQVGTEVAVEMGTLAGGQRAGTAHRAAVRRDIGCVQAILR
jgi:hypothetical protein